MAITCGPTKSQDSTMLITILLVETSTGPLEFVGKDKSFIDPYLKDPVTHTPTSENYL